MRIQIYIALIFFFTSSFAFGQAKIELSKTELNFDTLYFGQGARDSVYVKNVGNQDLVISEAHSSDGGSIVYSWTKHSIAPQDSGVIVAGFRSGNGCMGRMHKTVTILSNADIKVISLKSFFKRGAVIEFENDSINVDTVIDGSYPTRTFRFKNVGDEALIIIDAPGSGRGMARYMPKGPILPDQTDSIVFVGFNKNCLQGNFERDLPIRGNFTNGGMITWNKYGASSTKIIRMTGYNKKLE